MSKDSKNMSIKNRLEEVGVTVTDKKFGGWNNSKRMLIDSKGKELGFYSPLDAIKEFCK